MLKLDNVTLILMSSVDIDKCVKVLELSSEKIEFSSIKLITHEKPSYLPSKIEYCYIDKINSIDEYSYSMIYKLENYINTDFALIIQTDGYVINPESWKNEFLDYDYIGAPFQLPRDSFSYRDAFGNIFRVGNGGFSLRSKKLIKLANQIGLKWKPFHGFYNEDGFICAMYRHIYEDNDCKFAPLEIAKYFSHEAYIPEIENIIPFGFHGKNNVFYTKL
jgi:hypothetical protein